MDGSKVDATAEIVILEAPNLQCRRELDSTYGYDELKVFEAEGD